MVMSLCPDGLYVNFVLPTPPACWLLTTSILSFQNPRRYEKGLLEASLGLFLRRHPGLRLQVGRIPALVTTNRPDSAGGPNC